jgi:formylglycine-generating enzyme required for sulfatase activity
MHQSSRAIERIGVGFIGMGRQMRGLLNGVLNLGDTTHVVALCDVYQPNLDYSSSRQAPDAATYSDYRELLDRNDVDAVVISTPDHWHALQTIHACEAGIDVYVEKPSTHNVWEGRRMVEAVNRYNRMVQVGTMNRSRPAVRQAIKYMQEGGIGKVYMARGLCFKPRLAIGKYPVTFEEWDRCAAAGGCTYEPDDAGWGRGDRPVIHVARSDAEQYVAWLVRVTGQPYRLPSESEWEYAARAGTSTARWWGDDLGSARTVCDGCGSQWDNRSTAPVGSFPANPFGLHDMLGNVSEWVADCWNDTHADAPVDGSPRTEASPWWADGECARPVHRGGAWSFFPWTVRAAKRGYYHEWPGASWTERDGNSKGFRVVRDMVEGESWSARSRLTAAESSRGIQPLRSRPNRVNPG